MLRSFYPRPNFEVPGAGGVTPPVTPPPAALWYDGADQETVGYLTSRGWDKDAKVAAFGAIKAHKEAERFVGIPTSELLRLPKVANDPAWDGVWQRLGAPKEAKEYTFEGVKKADGNPPDDKFLDGVRAIAAELKLPKDRAPQLAQHLLKQQESAGVFNQQENAAKIALEKDTLQKNWGSNFNANFFVAQRAAQALGVTEAQIKALDSTVGHAAVMEMFRTIGAKIGEDKFISNGNSPVPGVMTKAEAINRRAELMADNAWVTRYRAGGREELNTMVGLSTLISA